MAARVENASTEIVCKGSVIMENAGTRFKRNSLDYVAKLSYVMPLQP
jgi:hypothetical protein